MAPSRTTLNARNLEALGAERLAELLLELSQGNGAAKRRLRLALAAAGGAEDAAREVRKRLKAIDQSGTFLDAAKSKTLLGELEGHLATITGSILQENPALAHDLHWELLELSEGILDRCYDDSGRVMGFFRRALELLPATVAAARPAPQALAERIADGVEEWNGFGQLDEVVELMAEALGPEGLEALRQECSRRSTLSESRLTLDIADALGDVEAFAAAFTQEDLQWPPNAAAVAERLLKVGRAEEALALLTAVDLEGREWMAELLREPQIAALEALGRAQEAQQVRWQGFLAELNVRYLRDYLKHLPDFEDVEAEEKALELVLADEDPIGALSFLVAWPDLRRAAALVLRQRDFWDGHAFEIFGPAAERLEADQPLAATVLLRSMIDFALDLGRSKRYRYAAQHLRRCAELAGHITDWQGLPDHSAYADQLRQRHGRKYGFWELADDPVASA